ncbi:PREDICTED: uncharacterized protein LOC104814031 [Tarenaya hassleriana]|uniref:uncharacterized protein LOC104814031 n=1 Tax=Tarenaya hassleriana TaxID=28532 RepID=UPI00053C0851|nr:PREDICTED: uncharacterized protein LOC104814031 [Tarenaya hassleriana]
MVREKTNTENPSSEMDKGRRDVRRGTNRFSKKKSGLISGVPGKSKKGGIFKKMGFNGEVNTSQEVRHQQDMGFEIEASSKKSKLPKRNFKDTNGVVHASVPRKLRSAMKKRKLDSVSRASKKLNMFKTGVESPKGCVKKERLDMESKIVTDPISKDEEEVVETLFTLAEMFPGTESADRTSRSEDALPDKKEAKPETIKAEVDPILVPEAEPTIGESRGKAVSVMSSAEAKQNGEMPVRQAEIFSSSTGTLDFLGRLKQGSVNVTEATEMKIDIALAMKAIGTKLTASDTGSKNSCGLALWPGLSSTINPGAHLLSKPSAVKVPPWMSGSASSPSKKASFRSDPLRVQPKKLKRCASHIYISRLIRVLQASTSPRALHQNEPIPSEVSVRRYPNVHPLDNGRTQKTKLARDMTPNQSYDFLSLSSAGDSNIMGNDATNGLASTSTSTSVIQSHFPPLNSIPHHHHHHGVRTFSMPQQETSHVSSAYISRFPSAPITNQRQPQLPPYLQGPFPAAAHNQQQFWAAAQYRAGAVAGSSMSVNHYAAYQNGKPNHALSSGSHSTTAASTRYNNVLAHHDVDEQTRTSSSSSSATRLRRDTNAAAVALQQAVLKTRHTQRACYVCPKERKDRNWFPCK